MIGLLQLTLTTLSRRDVIPASYSYTWVAIKGLIRFKLSISARAAVGVCHDGQIKFLFKPQAAQEIASYKLLPTALDTVGA